MRQENIKDVVLTAAGGTFMFDLFGSAQEVIEVTSSGSITLAANVVINRNIPVMGTLTDSFVKIRWTARVVPNGYTVTILGNTVNADLLDKDFIIDCHHGVMGWELKFLVDYADLVTNLGKHDIIATDGDSAVVSTINAAGTQTLRTLTYNKSPFILDGDKIKVTVAGNFAANANTKTVRVTVEDGITSINLFNTGGAFQGNFIFEGIFIACDISAGKWKMINFQNTSTSSSRSVTAPSALPTFDYSSTTWTFVCEGVEAVPTGNEITIYSFDVELIKR